MENQGEVDIELNWSYLYPDSVEYITPDMPYPKGKPVRITTCVDTNNSHYLETRHYLTGLITFLNKTPTQWYNRHHNTTETSTYGLEMVSTRISTGLTISK